MAARRRVSSSRQSRNINSSYRQEYVYGNTVRQPEILPKKKVQEEHKRPVRTSRQVRKNRRRALNMSPAYVAFQVIAAVCAVMICVSYLRLQSDTVSNAETVSALQEELATLTEQNDTAYQAATDSVNLEEIRNKAMNDMGMVYAAYGNVIEYECPAGDYVKQYNDIPSDGVLAKSRNAAD
ncbi:MAG: hypothetical protein QM793_09285 [Muricomes sp.]